MNRLFVACFLSLCLISNLMFCSSISEATDSLLLNGSQYNLSTGTAYGTVTGTDYDDRATGWSSEFGGVNSRLGIVASAGTLKNLRVELSAAPGAGKSYAFTLRLNQANTSVTCTVSGTATACTDTSNTATVAAGDTVSLMEVGSGTPGAAAAQTSLTFSSTTASETVWIGAATSDGNSDTATRSVAVFGVGAQRADVDESSLVLPTAGTVKNLYVKLSSAPGAGTSRVFTVWKNDAAGTTLTCTIADTATTCSDVTNSFTVVAGDWVQIQNVVVGAPVAGAVAGGLTFVPNTEGEFVVGTERVDPSTTATVYAEASGGDPTESTTETANQVLTQAATMKALYVKLDDGSPGAGTSYALTLSNNQSTTALTCTVSGAATACNLTTDVSVVVDDNLSFVSVPSATPTVRRIHISILGYIAPTTARRVLLIN